MNIIVRDDFIEPYLSRFAPFSINHASFEIKVGLFSNLDRIKLCCSRANIDIDKIYLVVRTELEELIQERYPDCIVVPMFDFDFDDSTISSLNSSNEKFESELLDHLGLSYDSSQIFDGRSVYAFSPRSSLDPVARKYDLNYLWDAIKLSRKVLYDETDLNNYKFNAISSFPSTSKLFDTINKKHDSAILVNEKDIIIHENSELKTGVIIDATEAAVIIGKNVVVDIGALIQGPVFIDDNTYIAPGAKIRAGTFIGKNCKVGGEVSCSFIYDHSNKVHDGFLGHSFVGEWVNIGAGTNNSNLNNNYTTIKYDCGDGAGFFDTTEQFLGAFIGDYSRLGISTMLNTGTHIGFGSNVFGAGYQNKYISPFSWGKEAKVNLEKFIETCEAIKKRRDRLLSNTEINFFKKIYNKNS